MRYEVLWMFHLQIEEAGLVQHRAKLEDLLDRMCLIPDARIGQKGIHRAKTDLEGCMAQKQG